MWARGKLWTLIVAALLLCWPAFWNGFPLMFPDSVSYLCGGYLLPALLRGEPFSGWHRSTCYELSILPLHGDGRWAWPVIVFHGLVTAWLLQLTLRAEGRRYLQFMLLLAGLTPAAWMVSYLMPDLTAGLGILSLYWLGPGWERLSPKQRAGILCLSLWSVTGHTANYATALAMAGVAGLLRNPTAAARVLAVTLAALALQLGLNYRIYGRWGVQIEQPPFLLARMLEDGPMARLLRERPQGYALEGQLGSFSLQHDDLLWNQQGLFRQLERDNPELWKRVRREEPALVLSTWLTYPGEQAAASLRAFGHQLLCVDAEHMLFIDEGVNFGHLRHSLPGLLEPFAASRQGRRELTRAWALTWLFRAFYVLSLAYLVWAWRSGSPVWKRLAAWVCLGILANALFSACLSGVNGRYHLRTIWLLAPLAYMLRQERKG